MKMPSQQITSENLVDMGYKQILCDTYSNGIFDLVLTKEGEIILYGANIFKKLLTVSTLANLRQIHHLNLIAEIGMDLKS